MRYRVYSGPKGSGEVGPWRRTTCCSRNSPGSTTRWPGRATSERNGRVPLLIEGDDGTRMNKRAIADALRVGTREQIGA